MFVRERPELKTVERRISQPEAQPFLRAVSDIAAYRGFKQVRRQFEIGMAEVVSGKPTFRPKGISDIIQP